MFRIIYNKIQRKADNDKGEQRHRGINGSQSLLVFPPLLVGVFEE
jgi:hypothetical protein